MLNVPFLEAKISTCILASNPLITNQLWILFKNVSMKNNISIYNHPCLSILRRFSCKSSNLKNLSHKFQTYLENL